MRKYITLFLLLAFIAAFAAPSAYAHMGEEELDSYHLMYHGMLKFPAWTYYAEIIIHFASLLVAVGAVLLIYYELRKSHGHLRRTLDYALLGFSLIAFGELMTTLHHFLIYPFGVLNAIINHGLLLLGLIFLVYAFFVLRDKEDDKGGKRAKKRL